MTAFSTKTVFFCIFMLAFCRPLSAKVVSIVDAPGDYASVGSSGGSGRVENNNNYKAPDKRCENFVGYLSAIPLNNDCDEAHPLPGVTCYHNCRCAYGTAANCTCNSSRYYDLNNLPRGTEPSGDTCKTKSAAKVYYAVRCKNGYSPDAGAKTCSCPYGEDSGCLCNSLEYPLLPHASFDYEQYEYAKCEYGNFYKISGCKQEGYQLVNHKCVPKCAAGYSASISACGEDHNLVEQEGFPVCKKCEKITCPAPYTFVNDCPDGTRVTRHPSQSGCFKCEGVPCSGQYHTYNVCQPGQNRKIQADNPACIYCEGTPCENGYSLNVSCAAGQATLNQGSNPVCQKCSGTACADGYRLLSSCEDGQTVSVQSGNPQCKKCSGTPCRTGYSTRIAACGAGTRLTMQSDNSACKKCEILPCQNGYSALINRFDCKDGQIFEQQAGTACGRCRGTPCADGYSTTIRACAPGRILLTQSSNSRCFKCGNAPLPLNPQRPCPPGMVCDFEIQAPLLSAE